MSEQVVDYYAEGGLSTIFHDLLAAVEPGCKDDVTFYASLLRTSPARILELGCGSGRVSLALAKRGHIVAGIDISKAMLARAMFQRACLDDLASSSRLNFTVGDMTSFSFPTQFDLIIAPYFAINHLPTRRAVMKTFVRVAEHLVPGAIFAIHIANVSRLARPLAHEATSQAIFQYDSSGSKLRLDIIERNYDQSTGQFTQILRYSMIRPDGSTERASKERLTYRAVPKEELDAAARRAGLCSPTIDMEAGETGRFVAFRMPETTDQHGRQ
jgi:SAM-dependent methyltransferase